MFALFKIAAGALTLQQGRITKKVFQPILKEYRDAESGITQGIIMNKRRTKIMACLKKRIWRITFATVIVCFLSIVYYNNFQMKIIDQWLDQKYDYIQKNNNTENATYSVEKMQKELRNQTFNPRDEDEY